MRFSLGYKWLNNRSDVIKMIYRAVDEVSDSAKYLKNYPEDTVLFKEGDPLDDIYILLDGTVQLYKQKPYSDQKFPVNTLQEGALIGIIAYTTHQPSLTTAITESDIRVLKIARRDFEQLIKKNPKFEDYLDEIILANLLERFRSNIILQMKLNFLNEELKNERNELKQAYIELKEAQNQLVYKEKMATLGQLVAGFAHEVNNPTAALLRSTDTLEAKLLGLMEELNARPEETSLFQSFYNAGKNAEYQDTRELRNRMAELEKLLPDQSRRTLRNLAGVPFELIREVVPDKTDLLDHCIQYYELGLMFRNIQSSGNRIVNLVKSLKSYSRSDTDKEVEEIDIREGIHDTLQLTSNRIKFYDLRLDLPDMPRIRANPAALNQVWTNIILNACDAMGKHGLLEISGRETDNELIVEICDNGPGIDPDLLEKIFEPNVSTKKTKRKFGLGLGLSISKNIIEDHNGDISARNKKEGGACFTVRLPKK